MNLRAGAVAGIPDQISTGTLSLDNLSAQTWDVLVIGAGVAGALAARQLALGGLKTLLIEGKAFPRQKVCGGCLSAPFVELLAEIGLPRLCDELGAPAVQSLRISREGRSLLVPLPAGRALSRTALDTALTAAAIEAGAEFVPEVRAQVTPEGSPKSGSRSVTLHSPGGVSCTVCAKVIVAADGLGHSSLQQLPEFESSIDPDSLIGLGTLLPGDSANWDEIPSGAISMAVGRGGYVGMVRVQQNQLNLAAAVNRKLLQAFNGDCGALISSMLRQAGIPTPRGLLDSQWMGTVSLTRSTGCVAGDRIFVAGDATGYVEPFTGEGMSWAAQAAIAIVPFVQRAVHHWQNALISEWVYRYRSLVGRNQFVCRTLAAVLRRPLLSATAMRVATTFPGITASVVRRLNRPLVTGVRTR